ncbi:MAG: glycogen synthase [Clostridia bacterium]|nr:glycogen synthase [Clostridia bacterium]
MKCILFAGGEISPFASTGGLADVMGSLPEAIKKVNPEIDVRCVMPLHSKVNLEWRQKMKFERWVMVDVSWRSQYCGIFSLVKNGVTYYFLDNEMYFNRSNLYGEYDDGERYSFFSYALLDMMRAMDFFPDVLHANDWQTALSVIALKQKYWTDERYRRIKAFYTIHNIEYQGIFDMAILGDVFGLDYENKNVVEFNGCINLTKGAIICADYVTTVSSQYAKEIQTEQYGAGLQEILKMYSDKVDGIVNGIDVDLYNPKKDKDIASKYSASNLSGKAVNKMELQKKFGLEVNPEVPVIAMVTRLAGHKGLDLVKTIAEEIIWYDAQFILLGTGEKEYEEFFRFFGERHPGKAGISISYDRKLSKLIYAGADMFLMPSKTEACGLAQMIASRYGTVPIVRETGGLYDTIKPYVNDKEGNGFTFSSYNAYDLLYVIRQAEDLYRDQNHWSKLMKKL